jgi:hypothetical protein
MMIAALPAMSNGASVLNMPGPGAQRTVSAAAEGRRLHAGVRPPDGCSATTKQLFHRQADIARDPPQQCWGNIAATVEWDSRAAAVCVPVLAMRPALPGFNEAQSFKQRRYLTWLENWQRARHYST